MARVEDGAGAGAGAAVVVQRGSVPRVQSALGSLLEVLHRYTQHYCVSQASYMIVMAVPQSPVRSPLCDPYKLHTSTSSARITRCRQPDGETKTKMLRLRSLRAQLYLQLRKIARQPRWLPSEMGSRG